MHVLFRMGYLMQDDFFSILLDILCIYISNVIPFSPTLLPSPPQLVSMKVLPLPITLSTSVSWLMMMLFFPWGCKPFSSFSPFSSSFIGVPMFSLMFRCKHPPLYLYDSGETSVETSNFTKGSLLLWFLHFSTMYIAALCIIPRNWKEPWCPSTEDTEIVVHLHNEVLPS